MNPLHNPFEDVRRKYLPPIPRQLLTLFRCMAKQEAASTRTAYELIRCWNSRKRGVRRAPSAREADRACHSLNAIRSVRIELKEALSQFYLTPAQRREIRSFYIEPPVYNMDPLRPLTNPKRKPDSTSC